LMDLAANSKNTQENWSTEVKLYNQTKAMLWKDG